MARRKDNSDRPLTAPEIAALKPRAERYEVNDGTEKGLRLRVHPTSVKSYRWTVREEAGGEQRVIVIGRFSLHRMPGFVTQSQARAWADRLRDANRAGRLAEEEAALRAEVDPPGPPPPDDTSPRLSTVADEFMKRRINPHRKRPEEAERALERDILPHLGDLPVKSITTAQCADVITAKVDDGAKGGAAKVLGLLKQLLSFAEGRGYIDRNPAARLDPDDLGIVLGRRKRWLTEEELPAFWEAFDGKARTVEVTRTNYRTKKAQTFTQHTPGIEAATCAALKLLLLTGVRTGELLRARWPDVDEKALTWTIPVANQKLTKKQALDAHPFVIPITPTAKALLDVLRRSAGASPWVLASPVLPKTPKAPFEPYEEKSLGHTMRRMFGSKEKPGPVVLAGGPVSPHDLRRTMRTHLGKLRIPPHITERCLNHSLGRIVQTYDLHDYLDERREALERWDGYLSRLVTGQGAEVVAIPGQAVTA